jgi:hypothetical protein
LDVINRERLNDAMKHVWDMTYKTIKEFKDKIETQDKTFRDTCVPHIEKLCDLLPKMNLTEDETLASLAAEISNGLTNTTNKELRDDKEKRTETAQKADEILKKMEGYM